jgi:hypothetical protein
MASTEAEKFIFPRAPLQSKVKNGGRGRPLYTPIPAFLRSGGCHGNRLRPNERLQ